MRVNHYARRAAVALAAVGIVGGAVAAAAPASGAVSPRWRVTRVFPASSGIAAIAAIGPRDAWALADPCDTCSSTPELAEHWNGAAWQPVKLPSGPAGVAPGGQYGTAVAASSPSNVWAFVTAGDSADVTVVQHWTGRGWAKPATLPATDAIQTAVTSGPRDAWVFGLALTSPTFAGYAAHDNGTRWTRVAFPLFAWRASEVAAGDIWAVGSWLGKAPKGASAFAVEHWSGRTWRAVGVQNLKLPKGEAVEARNVVAEGPDNVWAEGILIKNRGVGPGIVLVHWNGKALTQVRVPYPVSGGSAITGDGAGGLWLAASQSPKGPLAFLYHDNGGHWSRFPVPNQPKNSIELNAMTLIPGTHSVWAAGDGFSPTITPGQSHGLILKYGP